MNRKYYAALGIAMLALGIILLVLKLTNSRADGINAIAVGGVIIGGLGCLVRYFREAS